jgi:hypothetical protein
MLEEVGAAKITRCLNQGAKVGEDFARYPVVVGPFQHQQSEPILESVLADGKVICRFLSDEHLWQDKKRRAQHKVKALFHLASCFSIG